MGSSSPIIIWTFRRTGGTNLAKELFSASSFSAVQHEPFNGNRLYKDVKKHWEKNKDIDMLYNAIDKILMDKPLIKHCLEIMPRELNIALAELSIKHGYRHLFLYREEANARLLSLNYALKTKIWGKKQLKSRILDERVFDEYIDIKHMINHEYLCRTKMIEIFELLSIQNQVPLAVSFEMLYKSEFSSASVLINQIFEHCIGDSAVVTEDFLNNMLKKGGQGTRQDYLRFPNSQDFIDELEKVPVFKLVEPMGNKSTELNLLKFIPKKLIRFLQSVRTLIFSKL